MDWTGDRIWQYFVVGTTLALTILTAGHALLYKRDSRAATLWIGLIWFVPVVGAVLYLLLGVNRIKRQAVQLRGHEERYRAPVSSRQFTAAELAATLPPEARHLARLARATAAVLSRPLLPGNRVEPLVDGDNAYPAMLTAIEGAQRSITLATYIFDHDETGRAFAAALGAAARRGVEVRVLVDATGMRYSWPTIAATLRREGVPYARFRPTAPLWQLLSINLRNHRKLLVVDGRVGFTGGLNIRQGHWLARNPDHPVSDLHFRLEGPVVTHLQETFADDWLFTTGEALRGDLWYQPAANTDGPTTARGISDGPDASIHKLRWTILSALATAERSVRIATPYFLPDATLVAGLNLAAMRGVTVDILLPARSNLPYVQWASTAQWWQVLEHGCRLWLSPPPFDHSKLIVVDECWTLLGSANLDPRSLRLNFEFNVECYDPQLAASLVALFEAKRATSRRVTLVEVDRRGLLVRLRDSVARLFAPFL